MKIVKIFVFLASMWRQNQNIKKLSMWRQNMFVEKGEGQQGRKRVGMGTKKARVGKDSFAVALLGNPDYRGCTCLCG